jgi:hypothetical protein
VAIGVSIPPSPGTPSVEQGIVTFVNEGLPPPNGSGGPPLFLARLDGARRAQIFELSDIVEWTTPDNASWTEGAIPPCMAPVLRGQPARNGFGNVRARIRFGVLHVELPDGQTADLVVWVKCL